MPKYSSVQEQMVKANQPYTAKNIFKQLVSRIQKFEESLDQEHEVGIQLVSFGQTIQFSVSRMGCMDPSIIWFEGVLSDGSDVELVQHVNQLSFLLMALKRQHPEREKLPIGFVQGPQNQKESLELIQASAQQQEVASTKSED